MMTNPIRDTVYTVTVPVDLSAAVLAACRAEVAAGIKRAPTPMMRVLPPLTAAAACAAVLGVALYLGGNTPDDLPVLPPVGNEDSNTTEATDSTTERAEKPTTTTAEKSTNATTTITTTTTKPTATTTEKTTTTTTITTTTVKPTTTTTAKPTATTKPTTGKTELTTKTTKVDISDWPIIVADEPDNVRNDGIIGSKEGYITPMLQKKMELYGDKDVLYSVIVEVVMFHEDVKGFWESTDELSQFYKEYYDVYYAFEEEAKRLNPAYDGRNDSITVWTETMRSNYSYWLTLVEKWEILEKEHRPLYNANILNQRVEKLKNLTGMALIAISMDDRFRPIYANSSEYAFFMGLTADQITELAKNDYVIRLVCPDGDGEVYVND